MERPVGQAHAVARRNPSKLVSRPGVPIGKAAGLDNPTVRSAKSARTATTGKDTRVRVDVAGLQSPARSTRYGAGSASVAPMPGRMTNMRSTRGAGEKQLRGFRRQLRHQRDGRVQGDVVGIAYSRAQSLAIG
jgi:hypothetical protein